MTVTNKETRKMFNSGEKNGHKTSSEKFYKTYKLFPIKVANGQQRTKRRLFYIL